MGGAWQDLAGHRRGPCEKRFSKVLIVTLSSLKTQWQREIQRFTDQKAAGSGRRLQRTKKPVSAR
jgi:SNF2 family DNA or RNA helicase